MAHLQRNEHISEYRQRLDILTPSDRAKIQSACMIFKHLKVQSIPYLNEVLVVSNRRTRSNGQLEISRPNSEFSKRAFSYSATKFWNYIPCEVGDANSLMSFKRGLKEWMKNIE